MQQREIDRQTAEATTRSKVVEAQSATKAEVAARRTEKRRAEQEAHGYRERSKLGTEGFGSVLPAIIPDVPPTPTERVLSAIDRASKKFAVESRVVVKVDKAESARILRETADALERATG